MKAKVTAILTVILTLAFLIPARSESLYNSEAVLGMLARTALVMLQGGYCSGVVYRPKVILTAAHCYTSDGKGHRPDILLTNGQTLHGSWGPVDIGSDLAAVLLDAPATVPLPDSGVADISVGDEVWVIGSPEGEYWMVFHGYVAKLHTGVFDDSAKPDPTVPGQEPHQVMLLDSRGFPGNSGGPVFDRAGRLVGILVGGAVDTDPKRGGLGHLWAIAVGPQTLAQFANSLP